MRLGDTLRFLHNPNCLPDSNFHDLRKQVEGCLDNDDFERGLQISEDSIKRFPDKTTLTHSWTIDFLLSLGRKEEALKVLEDGFKQGAWWSPELLRTGWKELESHPEISRIMEMARGRFMEEKANARAELILRTPRKYSSENHYPLLLVLHGAYSNNDNSQYTWMSILKRKPMLLAFLQSSQIMSSDHFVWNDEDVALRDVKSALSTLARECPMEDSKVILGGVSRGAEIALLALFSGSVLADGFISVIPSVGAFIRQYVKKDTTPKWTKNVRGVIVAGEKDPRHQNAEIMYEFLARQGATCKFYSIPGLGHSVPNDFSLILERAVDFVLAD